MANAHKELIKIVKLVDGDLGGLYGILTKAEKELMRISAPKDLDLHTLARVTMLIKSLTASTSSLIRTLENEKDSLAILRRAPPGFFSSIVDFIYSVSVDPKSPDKKKVYYDKIKSLDRTINKEVSSLSSMMGVKDAQLSLQAQEVVEIWARQHPIADLLNLDIAELSKSAYESNNPINEIRELVAFLEKNLIDRSTAKVATRALFSQLSARLKEINATKEGATKIAPLLNKVEEALTALGLPTLPKQSSSEQRTTLAAASDFQTAISSYKSNLKYYQDNLSKKKFLPQTDSALKNVGRENKAEMQALRTLSSYIQSLYDPSSRTNIPAQVTKLEDLIEQIEASFSKQVPSEEDLNAPKPFIPTSPTDKA